MNYSAAEDYYTSGAPPPYVPVDPFKPSLAFSLNNVLPQRQPRRSRVAQTSSLHYPPQHARLHGSPHQRARYGHGPYPHIRSAPYPYQYPYPYSPNAEAQLHGRVPVRVESTAPHDRAGDQSSSHRSRGRSPTRRVERERPGMWKTDYGVPTVITVPSARTESSPRRYRPVYPFPTHVVASGPSVYPSPSPRHSPVSSDFSLDLARQPPEASDAQPANIRVPSIPLESPSPITSYPAAVVIRMTGPSQPTMVDASPVIIQQPPQPVPSMPIIVQPSLHHSQPVQPLIIQPSPSEAPRPVTIVQPQAAIEQPIIITRDPSPSHYTPPPWPIIILGSRSRSRSRSHPRSHTPPSVYQMTRRSRSRSPRRYRGSSRGSSRRHSPQVIPIVSSSPIPIINSRSPRSQSPSRDHHRTLSPVIQPSARDYYVHRRSRSRSPRRPQPIIAHRRHTSLSQIPGPSQPIYFSPSRSRSPRRYEYIVSPRRSPSPVVVRLPGPSDVYERADAPSTPRPRSPPLMMEEANVDAYEAPPDTSTHSTTAYIAAFLFDTVPRQIYLYMLLRLPHLYFSRVTRIFEEAEMSMPMIKQGILEAARAKAEAGYYDSGMPMPVHAGADQNAWIQDNKVVDTNGNQTSVVASQPYLPWAYWESPPESVAYTRLQNTWEAFIDSLQKEWKTLNIISVLLLSAILTILQIPSAAADPLTRYSALLSMICALMSLLYGCIYIIRFGTMRKTYKGAEWAEQAQRSSIGIFWNVWVLLAMPATWLAWSMILYIVTIMSFVWRTTPVSQPNTVDESSAQILVPRIFISLVVALGVIYFVLIAATLRKYGEIMDQAWQRRIWGWMRDSVDIAMGNGDTENAQAYTSNAFGGGSEKNSQKIDSEVPSRSQPNDAKQEQDANRTRGLGQSSGLHRPARATPEASFANANAVGAKQSRPLIMPSITMIPSSKPTRSSPFVSIFSANTNMTDPTFSQNPQNAEQARAKSITSMEESPIRMAIKDDDDGTPKLTMTPTIRTLDSSPIVLSGPLPPGFVLQDAPGEFDQTLDSEPAHPSASVNVPSVNANITNSTFSQNPQDIEPVQINSATPMEKSPVRTAMKGSDHGTPTSTMTPDNESEEIQSVNNVRQSGSNDSGSLSASQEDDHGKNPFLGASSSQNLGTNLGPSSSGGNEPPDAPTTEEFNFQNLAKVVKMFELSSADSSVDAMSEQDLMECGIDVKGLSSGDLNSFRQELCAAFAAALNSDALVIISAVAPILDRFNQSFHAHGIEGQVALCRELGPSSQSSLEYAVYLFSYFNPLSAQDVARMEKQTLQRYGSIADGLQKLDILILDSNTEIRVISLFPEHRGAQALRISTS